MAAATSRHAPPTASISLRMRSGARLEGEGDFIVAVPNRGILVLEVKGGAIEVKGGRWFQNGQPMRMAPRGQAHGYRGKLKRKLEESVRGPVPWIAIASAFPQTTDHDGRSAQRA